MREPLYPSLYQINTRVRLTEPSPGFYLDLSPWGFYVFEVINL